MQFPEKSGSNFFFYHIHKADLNAFVTVKEISVIKEKQCASPWSTGNKTASGQGLNNGKPNIVKIQIHAEGECLNKGSHLEYPMFLESSCRGKYFPRISTQKLRQGGAFGPHSILSCK